MTNAKVSAKAKGKGKKKASKSSSDTISSLDGFENSDSVNLLPIMKQKRTRKTPAEKSSIGSSFENLSTSKQSVGSSFENLSVSHRKNSEQWKIDSSPEIRPRPKRR